MKERRLAAGMSTSCSAGGDRAPASVCRVRSTVTAEALGFCTSTQVSMPPAVAPSARYQLMRGVVTPMESWPQARPGPYMARSQMTVPEVAVTLVETS